MADRTQRCLPQEALKLIACITMFIDHFGVAIVPSLSTPHIVAMYYILRSIGRIAFPLYCFLLVQGMNHTRNPNKYILRLGIGILLAELPFDLALFGEWTWKSQNVMVTLALGAVMLLCMQKVEKPWMKALLILPFAIIAELLKADYGAGGIVMVAVFALFDRWYLQAVALLLVNLLLIPSVGVIIFGAVVSVQLLAIFAMIPIGCYNGKKISRNSVLQWSFYLFYPVHLLVLGILKMLL